MLAVIGLLAGLAGCKSASGTFGQGSGCWESFINRPANGDPISGGAKSYLAGVQGDCSTHGTGSHGRLVDLYIQYWTGSQWRDRDYSHSSASNDGDFEASTGIEIQGLWAYHRTRSSHAAGLWSGGWYVTDFE